VTPRLLALALVLAACQGKGAADDAGPGGDASIAPRFTGKTLAGEYIALDDFRGKVVLLNIWATWCAPCRKELPELVQIQKQFGGDDFTVVGVSIDTERDFRKLKGMVTHFKLDYPIIFDPGGDSVTKFDVKGYPTSILVGKGGEMRWRRNGLISPRDSEVEAAIKAALGAP
jgi:thiol-disulfide isomerase/thioredoxin